MRLTYRRSDIPQPKREPAFASETLHDEKGRAAITEAAQLALQQAREMHMGCEQRQTHLAAAVMEASLSHRKELAGNIKET